MPCAAPESASAPPTSRPRLCHAGRHCGKASPVDACSLTFTHAARWPSRHLVRWTCLQISARQGARAIPVVPRRRLRPKRPHEPTPLCRGCGRARAPAQACARSRAPFDPRAHMRAEGSMPEPTPARMLPGAPVVCLLYGRAASSHLAPASAVQVARARGARGGGRSLQHRGRLVPAHVGQARLVRRRPLHTRVWMHEQDGLLARAQRHGRRTGSSDGSWIRYV